MATQTVLSERVGVAEDLLRRAERLIGAEGQAKLCGKLRSELKFLRRIQGAPVRGAHVHSSNLTHLSAVVQSAESLQNVVALLRVYNYNHETKRSLTVDVVADGGLLWVKAVGRKAEALHAVWQGRGQFGDRSVIGQAAEFLLAAEQHPLHYTRPRVLFAFYNGVSVPMATELERMGVEVSGQVIPTATIRGAEPEEEEEEEKPEAGGREQGIMGNGVHALHSDQDLDLDLDQSQDQAAALTPPSQCPPEELLQFYQSSDQDQDSEQDFTDSDPELDSDPDSSPRPLTCLDRSRVSLRSFPAPAAAPACGRVNLDVSTLLSLVSSLTHGGCGLAFREVVLTEQAADERRAPVLPQLQSFMAGKELVACSAAVTDFQEILRTLGGAKEKERAQTLLRSVTVVPDQPSPRSLALTPSAAVSPRSIAIFGTGDALHAVTMTANRKFVRAAANQGVHYSVFIHEPRALTEGKEWRATPVNPAPDSHGSDSPAPVSLAPNSHAPVSHAPNSHVPELGADRGGA